VKALIERSGTLVLLTETDTEEYAMTKWYQQACDGKAGLQIEMEQGMTNGELTLGPQPITLEPVPNQEGALDE